LEMIPSRLVKPPRVARSPVHLECVFQQAITLPGNTIRNIMTVVIGKVVGVHIADHVLTPDGRIDVMAIKPLCRLGYMDYAVIDNRFEMQLVGPLSDKLNSGLAGQAGGKV
jgi:flavin reductase (DIM6/NTAB) family NADH-FMN oxidoreductase RutF